jgi:hypothetical protein
LLLHPLENGRRPVAKQAMRLPAHEVAQQLDQLNRASQPADVAQRSKTPKRVFAEQVPR